MVWITERDTRLLNTLGAFGMLATRQVGELLFPDVRKTTLCRRLRTLEARGLIRRLRGLPDGSLMWTLSARSADKIGLEGRIRRVNRNSLEHDLVLVDLRIALSRAGVVSNWVPEHELRHKVIKEKFERRIEIEQIPDALITVHTKGNFHSIALELEPQRKSQSRYKKIFLNYLLMRNLWAIWYLVPNARMGERLEALWLKEPSYLRTAKFMWSIIPDVLESSSKAKIHIEGRTYLLTEVLTP